MATKKDLIEAQGFSRRRLLSAFTSGAPGGKELEPAKPLRAVAAGVALTAIVVIAGLFYGFIRPGLPAGWENNALILVKDTGARYIAIDGTLHPVINSASARLLMPPGEYKVVSTDRDSLDGIPIGEAIGILGAPDNLPAPGSLIADGWAACAVGDEDTAVNISAGTVVTASAGGAVVSRDGHTFVVIGERRYEVAADAAGAVLRAIGLDTATEVPVDGRWLNLFDSGTPLEPITIAGAGQTLQGIDLVVGAVVHPTGSGDDERYLMTAQGELAALSPLAYQLYLLGTGADLGGAQDVSPSQLASLPTASQPAGGADWPAETVTEVTGTSQPCAVLEHDKAGDPHTTLATTIEGAVLSPDDAGVTVQIDGGALVRAGGSGAQGAGMLYLIDQTGTAFPVPGANAGIVTQLGYDDQTDVARVPEGWVQFMPTGPALTQDAARSTPVATTGGD